MKKKTVYFSIHHLPQWLLLFSLLVSNVLFPVAAMADTGGAPLKEVWVDDDYSSSNDGEHTWSYDAFNNIQSGIDAVGADGTVHVAGGTYYALHEGDTILVNKSVKLVGEGKDTTFVDGRYKNDSLYSYNSYPIFHITASNVSISGFTIQNSGSGDYGAIYVTNGASNITIEENIFKNNIGDLYIDGESGKVSQKITFSGNIVSSDNGDPSIETWAIWGAYSGLNVITKNSFSKKYCTDAVIHLEFTGNNTITGNTISGNNIGSDATTYSEAAIYLDQSFNSMVSSKITGNTIENNLHPTGEYMSMGGLVTS